MAEAAGEQGGMPLPASVMCMALPTRMANSPNSAMAGAALRLGCL